MRYDRNYIVRYRLEDSRVRVRPCYGLGEARQERDNLMTCGALFTEILRLVEANYRVDYEPSRIGSECAPREV